MHKTLSLVNIYTRSLHFFNFQSSRIPQYHLKSPYKFPKKKATLNDATPVYTSTGGCGTCSGTARATTCVRATSTTSCRRTWASRSATRSRRKYTYDERTIKHLSLLPCVVTLTLNLSAAQVMGQGANGGEEERPRAQPVAGDRQDVWLVDRQVRHRCALAEWYQVRRSIFFFLSFFSFWRMTNRGKVGNEIGKIN